MNEQKVKALYHGIITGAAVIDWETYMFVTQGDENATDDQGNSV